jgi:hypothetical protein
MQFRQGDVFIVRIEKMPDRDLAPVKKEPGKTRTVLAYGEVTGHAHAIQSLNVALFEAPQDIDSVSDIKGGLMSLMSGDMFLDVKEPSVVVHEEHGEIKLDAGAYIVRRQREYHPEAPRTVAD